VNIGTLLEEKANDVCMSAGNSVTNRCHFPPYSVPSIPSIALGLTTVHRNVTEIDKLFNFLLVPAAAGQCKGVPT
jgi:hypothetical protein